MTRIALDAIRHCLDGQIPGVIATCSRDGVPNGSYVSQVHYVDPLHVALSFQFFNKTHENILTNPVVAIMVADPDTAARYRLQAQYLRTETEGRHLREHEGEARRHRLTDRHECRVQATRRRYLSDRAGCPRAESNGAAVAAAP